MWTIITHQIKDSVKDAKYIFVYITIIMAFIINGVAFSYKYDKALEAYQKETNIVTQELSESSASLQAISNKIQNLVKPPSVLAFIANSGESKMPNAFSVNAFHYRGPFNISSTNQRIPALPAVDWMFIASTLLSLLAIMLSSSSICGEKKNGTLRLILSNSISRMTFFCGKFLGLLFALLLILLIGVAISLTIISMNGSIPLSDLLPTVGWAVLLIVAYLIFVLLLGMAISSSVSRPGIALTILLIIWVIGYIAVPGIGRLIGENSVEVLPKDEIISQMAKIEGELWRQQTKELSNWDGNASSRLASRWVQYPIRILEEKNEIFSRGIQTQINQAKNVSIFSSFSPSGILCNALIRTTNSGVYGFDTFHQQVRFYQKTLHNFTISSDRQDPESRHLVWSWDSSTNDGYFSTKPVAIASVPRFNNLWQQGGFAEGNYLPLFHLLILFLLSMVAAIIGFIAFVRFDPR
jgi:ABC-type transport system involved in multi-copper enzyme maturation permease subunit